MLGTEERLNKYLLNKQTNWTLKKREQIITFTGESLPFFHEQIPNGLFLDLLICEFMLELHKIAYV